MSRLPVPGSDDGVWGEVLNDFLLTSHDTMGDIKPDAVQKALPAASNGQALLYNSAVQRWQPGLVNATVNESNFVHKSGAETISGSKDFTGGLTQYGIGLVLTDDIRLSDERVPDDNSVTDAKVAAGANIAQSKIAGLTADLASKIPLSQKGQPNGVASLDANGLIPQSQVPPSIVDATPTQKGVVQLAGDVGGTAAAPTVTGIQGRVVDSNAPTDGQVLTYDAANTQWESQDIQISGYVRGDGIAKVTVGIAAPLSPAVGDVWIDTA